MRTALKLMSFVFSLLISHRAIGNPMQINYVEAAAAEVKAWQAYYQKNPAVLLERTGVLLAVQYPIKDADTIKRIANEFFIAYHKFGTLPQDSSEQNYQQEVLPLIVKAYTSLKETINAPWDAADAAKADLSWWVARRQDKQKDPELVGKKIELLYSILYGLNNDDRGFLGRAGYFRATAARYRDLCQDKWGAISEEDWKIIQLLLEESYDNLNRSALPPYTG
jgi:hypothetical protein